MKDPKFLAAAKREFPFMFSGAFEEKRFNYERLDDEERDFVAARLQVLNLRGQAIMVRQLARLLDFTEGLDEALDEIADGISGSELEESQDEGLDGNPPEEGAVDDGLSEDEDSLSEDEDDDDSLSEDEDIDDSLSEDEDDDDSLSEDEDIDDSLSEDEDIDDGEEIVYAGEAGGKPDVRFLGSSPDGNGQEPEGGAVSHSPTSTAPATQPPLVLPTLIIPRETDDVRTVD